MGVVSFRGVCMRWFSVLDLKLWLLMINCVFSILFWVCRLNVFDLVVNVILVRLSLFVVNFFSLIVVLIFVLLGELLIEIWSVLRLSFSIFCFMGRVKIVLFLIGVILV